MICSGVNFLFLTFLVWTVDMILFSALIILFSYPEYLDEMMLQTQILKKIGLEMKNRNCEGIQIKINSYLHK